MILRNLGTIMLACFMACPALLVADCGCGSSPPAISSDSNTACGSQPLTIRARRANCVDCDGEIYVRLEGRMPPCTMVKLVPIEGKPKGYYDLKWKALGQQLAWQAHESKVSGGYWNCSDCGDCKLRVRVGKVDGGREYIWVPVQSDGSVDCNCPPSTASLNSEHKPHATNTRQSLNKQHEMNRKLHKQLAAEKERNQSLESELRELKRHLRKGRPKRPEQQQEHGDDPVGRQESESSGPGTSGEKTKEPAQEPTVDNTNEGLTAPGAPAPDDGFKILESNDDQGGES